MKTLSQLRSTVYALLREDNPQIVSGGNTHFADSSVIDGFLNEGAEFAGVFIEYPRSLVSVQTINNVGSYANPSDNLLLRTAYFGDNSISADIRPITIISEETLKTIYPSWLDNTSNATADSPQYLIQLDRKTIHIFPRPNAVGSASGKKIWLNYNYNPTAMVNDNDTPDLPAAYQDLLPLYALHLCYYALQVPALSAQFYKDFMEKVQRIKSAVTKETKEGLGFSWGTNENLNDNYIGGIVP